MRRKEKEIADPGIIREILEEAGYGHLALADGDLPYVIPMNFVSAEEGIWLHSAGEGEKLRILRQHPRASFAVETGVSLFPAPRPCNAGMRYRSVIISGKIEEVKDHERKHAALLLFARKYTPDAPFSIPESAVDQVTILLLRIDRITGKQSGYPGQGDPV